MPWKASAAVVASTPVSFLAVSRCHGVLVPLRQEGLAWLPSSVSATFVCGLVYLGNNPNDYGEQKFKFTFSKNRKPIQT